MAKNKFLYNEVFLHDLHLCVIKSQSKLLLMPHFWELITKCRSEISHMWWTHSLVQVAPDI